LVSEKLASHSKYILGVDASQGMADVYNQKCWQQGIDKKEMEAVCQMLTEEASEKGDQLNGKRFDIIVVGIYVSCIHYTKHQLKIYNLQSFFFFSVLHPTITFPLHKILRVSSPPISNHLGI